MTEALEPGATVSVVADRNGISRSQVYAWKRLAQRGGIPGISLNGLAMPSFAPVRIEAVRDDARRLHGAVMSEFYAKVVKECREHHSKLLAPDARSIWLAQKELEGMSAAEGARDYEISVKASKDACEAFIRIQQLNTQDYEEAKRKLNAVR